VDLTILLKTRFGQNIRNSVKVYCFYNQINVQRQTIDLRQHFNAVMNGPDQARLYSWFTCHDLFGKQRCWWWRITG